LARFAQDGAGGGRADALLGEQLLGGAQELLSRANDFHQD